MPRGIIKDAEHFEKILKEAVILVDGDGDSIDTSPDADKVSVAIVVNVTGYGPHVGTIYAEQGRHPDSALQEAFEILEHWELDHNLDYLKELEKEYEKEHEGRAMEVFTETFDGWSWVLDPKDFAKAIKGTKAEKYVETYDSSKED